MRTVLISLVLATLSACSLYFDDSSEHKGKLGGVPDAGLDHDGGGAGSDCSDGGVDGGGWSDGGPDDGGSWHPDGGSWHPDGGSWHPDGGAHDAGAPDAYDQDAGAAPDAHF